MLPPESTRAAACSSAAGCLLRHSGKGLQADGWMQGETKSTQTQFASSLHAGQGKVQ